MTERKCTRCKTKLPLTTEHFCSDKSRKYGLSYECKSCMSARKAGKDHRPLRWAQMTPEQLVIRKAAQAKYNRSDKGRAVFLRHAYRRTDACDLTSAEVYELIVQPCIHCGTADLPRGLDRIDNTKPHIKGNVVPSCAPCNFARGDRFTFEEMKVIGALIRQIIRDRSVDPTPNAGGL
jgi:hypothetical protein